MRFVRSIRGLLALAGALTSAPAAAQAPPEQVPYVPTLTPVVSAMLALGEVDGADVLYDLGSGDGRILITAAQRLGTRGVGFEIEPQLVELSQRHAAAAGVDSLVRFLNDDLFTADLRPASVVALYLSPSVNLQLRPQLLAELEPGSRVVSHAFHMGDWAPDTVVQVGEGYGRATVYGWVVPADVDGFWQLVLETERGEEWYVLELDQRYQRLAGQTSRDGTALPLAGGEMEGRSIRFTLRPREESGAGWRFSGELAGEELRGAYGPVGQPRHHRWRAVRFSR